MMTETVLLGNSLKETEVLHYIQTNVHLMKNTDTTGFSEGVMCFLPSTIKVVNQMQMPYKSIFGMRGVKIILSFYLLFHHTKICMYKCFLFPLLV